MTTRIGVTVGDGGLVEQNAQQQAASRQGFVVRRGQERAAEVDGRAALEQERAAQGLDPATGLILPSSAVAGSRASVIRRIDQKPAANRLAGLGGFIHYYNNSTVSGPTEGFDSITNPFEPTSTYVVNNWAYYGGIKSSNRFNFDEFSYSHIYNDIAASKVETGVYNESCITAEYPAGLTLDTGIVETLYCWPTPRSGFYPLSEFTYARDFYASDKLEELQPATGYILNIFLYTEDFLSTASMQCSGSFNVTGLNYLAQQTGSPPFIAFVEGVTLVNRWNRLSLSASQTATYIHINGSLFATFPSTAQYGPFFYAIVRFRLSTVGDFRAGVMRLGTARFDRGAKYTTAPYAVTTLLKKW